MVVHYLDISLVQDSVALCRHDIYSNCSLYTEGYYNYCIGVVIEISTTQDKMIVFMFILFTKFQKSQTQRDRLS